jgi:uncharacterized protein
MSATVDSPRTASPCISVCTIDPVSGLCAGCYRTLDEIASWIDLDDGAKRALIAVLPARRPLVRALSDATNAADGER